MAALARIALAAKQAKPSYYLAEWPCEIGGFERELCDTANEAQAFSFEYDAGVTPLYTNPQPAHTEQVIPDGWKLVPIEPTYEMKKHYYDASLAPISKLSVTGYRSMLAASPKPEIE